MKISYQHQAIHTVINEACEVTKSHLVEKDIDFVMVKINGRYPLQHLSTNQVCKEMIYVSEGHGRVVVEGQEYSFNAGDTIIMEAGEKFFWEGHMTLLVTCRPAWFSEQHVAVDNGQLSTKP